jgi:biofilm PGA synthesis N-glycosyltransferase PgaC
MDFSLFFYYLIAVLSLLNLVRVLVMLVGSDIYDIHQIMRRRRSGALRAYKPLITVVIPAYNEETGVIRTLESVLANSYTKRQVIVVNDGSTDRTLQVLRNYRRRHPGEFTVVNQSNSGKAVAINHAVRDYAKGKLVMVLDADSVLHPDGLQRMVAHFRDRYVIAASSNVKVLPSKSILGITQRFEYLISYRMKRALSTFRMEYIVGGVGSTFRRSALLRVGLYDTDTMTEDIDLTVKLIAHYGNRRWRVHYAADVLTYTEHVIRFRSLIRQRFRWKFGRLQTLLKHSTLFFGRSKKHTKQLTWYQLPYALFGEFILLLEPILVGFIVAVVVLYGDFTSLVSVYAIVTTFIFLIVLGEGSESFRSKLGLSLMLPLMYFLLYILSIVEFVALMRSLYNSRKLFRRELTEGKWEHVERTGEPVSL